MAPRQPKSAKKAAPKTKKASAASAKSAREQKPEAKIIDTSIKNDRSVEIRGTVPINASTVAQIQRGLLLQSIAKNGDGSSLKLYLGPCDSNKYRLQDQAALADTMTFIYHPVDTIIRSGSSPDVLKAFLATTGKRYMLAGATLYMGVITNSAPYGKNKASQVRRQLANDYLIDLQTQVMLKTGEADRNKVFKDLLSARGLNAMEALYYGTRGLIDAILIGHDQVVTRVELEAYYRGNKMDAQAIADFNKHYINVYKLSTRPLRDFSPESVPEGTTSLYKSLKKPGNPDEKKDEKKKEENPPAEMAAEPVKPATASEPAKPRTPVFYIGEKKIEDYPLISRAVKDKSPRRIMVENLNEVNNGFLDDDVIFFNDGFRDETAEQIGEALVALDHKKVSEGRKSHIKILENSPGGSIWSGQELRSIIKSLQTPVDVLVYGMGASCGSWLLCSATGNRYATPHARIMFHEAASELRHPTPHDHFNEMHDDLDQATLDYVAIVAQATGRPFEDVLKDFDLDVWLNPVEALFYGPKGLIDAIIVDYNRVIVRQDVEKYLVEVLGGKSQFKRYVETKILEKRDPRQAMEWRPELHREDDPFDNPLKVIAVVTERFATPLSEVKSLRGSAPDTAAERTIDFFNVVTDDDKK